MKRNGRLKLDKLASILFAITLFLVFSTGKVVAKELKIGVLGWLSGPASEAYSKNTYGSHLGADWINKKGGITIKGEKYSIKIIDADNQGTLEGTIAAANKLIFDDKVKFIAGAVPPPPFVAAYSNIVEENKVFRVIQTALGVSAELNATMTYTVGTFPSTLGASPGYDALVELYPKAKRLGLICPEDPGAFEELEHQKKLAAAHGLKLVVEATHQFGQVDFYPMWTKILPAKPDVVVVHATIPQWGGAMLKQGRELGFKGVFMVPCCNIDPNILLQIAGAYATDYIGVNYDTKNPTTMTPEMKEMAKLVEAKFSTDMCMDYFVGIEGIWMLAQAIEHAQSLDPTVVRDHFAKTKDFKTVYGPATVGGKKYYGRDCTVLRPVQVIRIMNGKIQHVRWTTPEEE